MARTSLQNRGVVAAKLDGVELAIPLAAIPLVDAQMWRLRDLERPAQGSAGTPWWNGDTHFVNYTPQQIDCVACFLQFVRDQGETGRLGYMWEAADDLTLQRWRAANG